MRGHAGRPHVLAFPNGTLDPKLSFDVTTASCFDDPADSAGENPEPMPKQIHWQALLKEKFWTEINFFLAKGNLVFQGVGLIL